METIKKELVVWVCLLTFLLCWFLALELTHTPFIIGWELFSKLPEAVTLFFIVSAVFKKWAWRWPWVMNLVVQLPDLQGTWQGELQSMWENESGRGIPPLPVILVIRQDYSSISCTMFTKTGSDSRSRAAQLIVGETNKSVTLSYTYTSRSKVTDRELNPMHDGAAILRVISVPERSLEGEYWTGRRTIGHVGLRFHSKKLFDRFPDD